jgi:hypothetical protein
MRAPLEVLEAIIRAVQILVVDELVRGGSAPKACSITRCSACFLPLISTSIYPLYIGVGAVTMPSHDS